MAILGSREKEHESEARSDAIMVLKYGVLMNALSGGDGDEADKCSRFDIEISVPMSLSLISPQEARDIKNSTSFY